MYALSTSPVDSASSHFRSAQRVSEVNKSCFIHSRNSSNLIFQLVSLSVGSLLPPLKLVHRGLYKLALLKPSFSRALPYCCFFKKQQCQKMYMLKNDWVSVGLLPVP